MRALGLRQHFSTEHKIVLMVIAVSVAGGLLYGLLADSSSTISRIDFANYSYIEVFWKILSHNFLVSLVVLALSIFFYIGSSIPVVITYFAFGSSFAVIAKQKGLLTAIVTYPHLLFETIQIFLVLTIAYKLSRKILEQVNLKKNKRTSPDRLMISALYAAAFMILGALVESVRIEYF